MTHISISPKTEFNILEIEEAKDGELWGRTITPSDDVSGETDEQILAAIAEYHTPEIKAAYQAMLDANAPDPLTDAEIICNAEAAIRSIRNAIYANGDAGQTASYAQKLEQAKAYKAADYSGTYSYLVEGIKDQPFTKQELADSIIGRAEAYMVLDAKIEAARTIVKVKVTSAALDQKQAAADLVVTDLQTLISAILAA
ncbi:MAG: hypothetical protein HRU28_14535 [Rhizobiales bacterium]|nr:hypothetical protein [Hyphomicrobiales bacterium]